MSDAAFILKFIETAYRVLSVRLVLIFTMLLCFSLFAWAMYEPDYPRITVATIFAVLVFLPVRQLEVKKEPKNSDEHAS